jgi:hypothetical protein
MITRYTLRPALLSLGLLAAGLTLPPTASALDRSGNYTTADFFPTRDEYALSTWKVVATRLHCRRRPGINQPIVATFSKNNALLVKTSEGSHENVGYLQMDGQGQPWMRVSAMKRSYPPGVCFVRAHRAYVAPVVVP